MTFFKNENDLYLNIKQCYFKLYYHNNHFNECFNKIQFLDKKLDNEIRPLETYLGNPI